MKKSLFCFLFIGMAIISLLGSCRKEAERTDLGENVIISEVPPHCLNGVLDEGESDVDCGMECPACVHINAPCETTLNHMMANSTSYTVTSACEIDGSDFTLTGTSSGFNKFVLEFQNAPSSGIYPVAIGSTGSLNEVGVRFDNGYTHASIGTGEVYVNVSGSQTSVELCNITVIGTEGFVEVTYHLTGNLTCN